MWGATTSEVRRNRRIRRSRIDRRIIFLTLGLGLLPALISPALGAERQRSGSPTVREQGAPAARAETGHAPQASSQSHGTRPSGRPEARPGRPRGGHEGQARHRQRPYYRPYVGPTWHSSVYWGLGGYWPGWYGGYPYYGYGPGVVIYPGGSPARGSGVGALDLDVSPERAAVYIDGELLGVCDDYDGFPDFLWLEPGTYDLVIYQPGFRTLARQVTVEAGVVVDIEDRMEIGEAVLPEDLVSKSTERRDERLRRDRERLEEISAREAARERAAENEPRDFRGEPGRLQLQIVPMDASVYLDGRFLGTGEELARLHAGLLVDPGPHRLEVVRPGFESVERRFDATAGAAVEVSVKLEQD